jgi:hypothetical protein
MGEFENETVAVEEATKSVAENLTEAFELTEKNDNDLVKLRVVVVGDILTLTAHKGDTIGDLKANNGYEDTVKITNKMGVPLRDDFVIEEDMDLYLSVPKSNG